MPVLANAGNALPESRFSRHVRYLGSVDSTNREARDLGVAGEPDGTIVLADEQTAGRGRRRRHWVSPAGAGLYVSILLRPSFAAEETGPAIQLAAGIAVAEALGEFLPRRPTLRWPNDCYVAEEKIAGVLVEAETTGVGFDFLVCGAGINVNHAADDFPDELRGLATSISLQVGHRVSRFDVLAAFLAAFDVWEGIWREHGLAPIRERWLELSPLTVAGRVAVQTESGMLEGDAEGLSERGHLRVRDASGVHEVGIGEVVRLRPS